MKKADGKRWRVTRRPSELLGARAGRDTLRSLKCEVAQDLGLQDDIAERGFANMTTREVGTLGGHMVRRLVARGRQAMARDRRDR
ncbi:MAG: small, acid-soluble spore protein, alpha/beta type [Thermaerobacter sp.]|nr:small, acid-soluble spore protein, alpha/beta type [Thermaerobacter sp.]